MTKTHRGSLKRLLGWRDYLDAHHRCVPRAYASAACAKLHRAIDALTDALIQYDCALAKIALDALRRATIRREIHAAMHPVIAIAQTLTHIPELSVLTLPRTDTHAGRLVGQLYALADAVTRHRDTFASAGLEDGTPQQLRRLADQLALATSQRQTSALARQTLRAEICASIRLGHEAAQVLDILVAAETPCRSRLTPVR